MRPYTRFDNNSRRRNTGEKVINGQHRMGFTATKVGLQLHYRIFSFTGQSLDTTDQQPPQAFRKVSPTEKFQRFAALIHTFTQVYRQQIPPADNGHWQRHRGA